MYRWSLCPGSVRESRGKKSKSSKYAEEGTEAHRIGAECLTQKLEAWEHKDCDAEMVEPVQTYLDFVRELVARCAPGEMHVVDLKYGAGIPVEAVGNPQLRYYGLGAYITVPRADTARLLIEHRFDLSSVYPGCFGTADVVVVGAGPTTKLHLHIVQPRCNHPAGPVRSETIDAIDLLDFRADLVMYAKATEDPNAPLVTGDHCRFCPAAPTCVALSKRTQDVARLEFGGGFPAYDPAKLKEALDARPAVEAWLKAVAEFAYAEAERGVVIPGYKLVAKQARRAWREGAAPQVELVEGVTGLDLHKPREILSPAQVEKIAGTKMYKNHFAELVVKESSGHVLVPESDKRAPVSRLTAAQEFTAVPLLNR